jgi:hypothetical protein
VKFLVVLAASAGAFSGCRVSTTRHGVTTK